MLRLLQWLVYGHVHEWETIAERKLVDNPDGSGYSALGRRYVLRCRRCGEVVKRDLI